MVVVVVVVVVGKALRCGGLLGSLAPGEGEGEGEG